MMQQHEYIGKILPDGQLTIPRSLSSNLIPGQKVKVCIEPLPITQVQEQNQSLDANTSKILSRMRNARAVGVPDDPEVLRHSVLLETNLEDKFSWKE